MNISQFPPRRVSDPGAPQLRADVALVLAGAWLTAAVVVGVSDGRFGALAVLGACLVVGELLVIEFADGTALPLSLAVLVPLAVGFGPGWVALAAAGAGAVAVPLRRPSPPVPVATTGVSRAGAAALRQPWSPLSVATTGASRALAAVGGWGAQRLMIALAGDGTALPVLGSLVAAGVVVLAVQMVVRHAEGSDPFPAPDGVHASFAIVATGVLMGVGYDGLAGQSAMGLWAIPVFAVPALSARWAYGRLRAIRQTYDQTISVLSMVPEMGGRVRPGHSRRVADLSLDMARLLGVSRATAIDLERAALLLTLGSVTLDDTPVETGHRGAQQMAAATAAVLRDEDRLSSPAGLVAGMVGEDVELHDEHRLAVEVLKAAAAYENVAGGNPARARLALDVVASRPGRGHRDVAFALARVVASRRISATRV